MIKANNMEKVTEEYIEGMYYRKMYDSAACLKGDVRVVDRELKKLTSDTARYDALKENVMIRVKGLGWDWCKHAWSKNGQQYSIKELADHLKWIIKEERKRHIVIPSVVVLFVVPVRFCNPFLPIFNHVYLHNY